VQILLYFTAAEINFLVHLEVGVIAQLSWLI